MSFEFSDPATGKRYKVEGPPGFSIEQAQQVFDGQLKAGSLVGLKPGMILDAASQAAGGLETALSQVTQQVQQAAGTALSTAGAALKNITGSTFKGIASNGINVADFAKQAPALGDIGKLAQNQMTSTLSQASKLVGQASGVMTDALGAGKFGLSGSQLETAGLLKPGTTSTYLAQAQNGLTDVLKSPSVWTGAGGITGASNLLSSVPTQDRVQQQLMQAGTSALSGLGVPVDKLSPQALSGTALNAAKSVQDALGWATGGSVPSQVKSAFDSTAQNAAFAVNFGDQKVSDAMKKLTPPELSTDTVDRATVNAAATRVVGNEKVPPVDYNTPTPAIGLQALKQELDVQKERIRKFDEIRSIKISEANAFKEQLDKELVVLKDCDIMESRALDIIGKLQDIKQRAKGLVPPTTELDGPIDSAITSVEVGIDIVKLLRQKVQQIIDSLTADNTG